MKIYEYRTIVRFSDTDSYGVVHHSNYFRLLEEARIDLMENELGIMMDEPVNGLDPVGIIELRELLKRLNKERGITILISSHLLSELHQLVTCYGFIHKWKMIE